MSHQFEDEFMDLQSELISLCLEATDKKVDKIYAYVSIEEKSKMFNAFFDVNGEVKTLNQLGLSNSIINQLLKLGTGDLEKIKSVCKLFNNPVPTEIKMYYDVNTGKYNADYKYNEVCSARTGVSAGEIFMNWITDIKSTNKP
jgi:hypothetical protein